MPLNLLDRFDRDEDAGAEALAEELADLLGGRRLLADYRYGVLAWGLPSLMNRVAASADDREHIAACIAQAIRHFQPRLENVRVTPTDNAGEFSCLIEASVVEDASSISLRVLSPHVGGALGATVDVVDIRQDY